MVQKKIPLINSAHGLETRNTINELIKTFNAMGYTYDEALQKAHDVLSEAQQTNNMNKDVQRQLNDIILENGNSEAEVVQARGGYSVLNERLNETDVQVEKTVKVANVKAFGAVGDGIADDTVAIKNAIQSVTQHGQLYFPAGIYRITDTITNNNSENTPFAFDWIGESTGTFILIDINDMEKNAIEILRVNHIKVRNLTLIGKEGCAKNGFYTYMMMRSEFENVTVLAGVDTMMETVHGYCNRINIKSPNSLHTGTHMKDVISGKWAHPRRGIYMTAAFATEFDVILEALSGNGIESDDAIDYNQSITIIGTIENIKGKSMHLKNINVLVIDNLYEEHNTDGLITFEDCHFIDIVGHRGHYESYKFLSCTNVNSGYPQFMQDVTGNNGYADDSPFTFNASLEIESSTADVAPVRNTKSSPKFLAYPFFDRFNSNSLVDSFTYSTSGLITDGTRTTNGISGAENALLIPQTNYNHLRLNLENVEKLEGRFIYVTLIIKKPVTSIPDAYYDLSFVTKDGNARGKQIRIDDLENGWNRITMATKLSSLNSGLPTYFRLMGSPTYTNAGNKFLPIEICYMAITADNPSTSPFDFDGTTNVATYKNGNKEIVGDAIPTEGQWVKGDKVFNTTPATNGNEGWVCTTSGSPGLWKKYGIIYDDLLSVYRNEESTADFGTIPAHSAVEKLIGSAGISRQLIITPKESLGEYYDALSISYWINSSGRITVRIVNSSDSSKTVGNVTFKVLIV